MTKLLEQVFEKLQALPDEEQDRMAGYVLDELQNDDAKWEQTTSKNPAGVKRLIAEVEASYARGECLELDPDKL